MLTKAMQQTVLSPLHAKPEVQHITRGIAGNAVLHVVGCSYIHYTLTAKADTLTAKADTTTAKGDTTAKADTTAAKGDTTTAKADTTAAKADTLKKGKKK